MNIHKKDDKHGKTSLALDVAESVNLSIANMHSPTRKCQDSVNVCTAARIISFLASAMCI